MKSKARRKTALEVVREVGGVDPGPGRRIKIADCTPNDWNQNVLVGEDYEKLRAFLNFIYDATGHFAQPIVVRPHPGPNPPTKYQIIDGEHRWKIWREERHKRIDAWVVDVDDKKAMLLTPGLNYLRGEPDPDKQVDYLRRLNREHKMSPKDMAEYLPATEDEIFGYFEAYDVPVEHVDVPDDDPEEAPEVVGATLLELKFTLPREDVEVVEAEIARLAASIGSGKNLRGRALRLMAEQSSRVLFEVKSARRRASR